ncbi:cyclin-B1-4-like [Camellia sinensis]|uniref:cyclin-B1-4-like n=1 Tax=Camellia sinensis TaxID=4442 RepID=UPI0010367678|nr:cyclin-B1-4-like [Camellia sinensis]
MLGQNFFITLTVEALEAVAAIEAGISNGSTQNILAKSESELRKRFKSNYEFVIAQPEINSKMRSILIDWLTEVHRMFELMPETLYLTINIVDRYLSMNVVPRRELQLVGISSMLIACKYEEIWAPEVIGVLFSSFRTMSDLKIVWFH